MKQIGCLRNGLGEMDPNQFPDYSEPATTGLGLGLLASQCLDYGQLVASFVGGDAATGQLPHPRFEEKIVCIGYLDIGTKKGHHFLYRVLPLPPALSKS